MANAKNVDAMTRLLEEFDATVKRFDSPAYRAEWLAARGVLVPSALTDEQGYDIGCVNDFTVTRSAEREAVEARAVRSELERIARGEG